MPRALVAVLATTLALCALALRSPPPFRLDVGAPADARFLQGWQEPERGDGLDFRWSRPGSRLVLHGADIRPLVLTLRLHPGAIARRVRLFHRGRAVASLVAEPGWREYRLPLSLAEGSLARPPRLDFDADPPFEAHDGRTLGLMLDWLLIEADPGRAAGWSRPLARAAALTVGLGLLFALLVRGRPVRLAGSPVLLLILAASGAALAAAISRAPYLTAFALPLLPVSSALLVGLLLVRRGAPASGVEPAAEGPRWPLRQTAALLGLCLLAALAMRGLFLRELPWGLWRDEAYHGLVALHMLEDPSYRPVYVDEPHVNLPALGLYPFALALRTFGVEVWSLRTVTAAAGALTVLALYGVVLGLLRRRDVALAAAALLAFSSWHVSVSRFSFPTAFDPLLTLTGLWLLLQALASSRAYPAGAWAAGAGVAVGLAVQTYHSARVAPLLVALLLLSREGRAAFRVGILLPLLLAFSLTVAPLALYAGAHAGAVGARVRAVSLLHHAAEAAEPPLLALDDSLGRHLLMFNVRGDKNGRHHAPGQPLLDPVTGLGFLVGLLLPLVGRRRGPGGRFLLGALGLAVLPSLLAVDGPHALRAIGAAPFACAVAAHGWFAVAARTSRPGACLAAALVLAAALNAERYFVDMARNPGVWGAAYPVQTRVGEFVRHLAQSGSAGGEVYVSSGMSRHPVFAYLTWGVATATFDGAALSQPVRPGSLFVITGRTAGEDLRALAPYLGHQPTPWRRGPVFPGTEEPSFLAYRARGEPPIR